MFKTTLRYVWPEGVLPSAVTFVKLMAIDQLAALAEIAYGVVETRRLEMNRSRQASLVNHLKLEI